VPQGSSDDAHYTALRYFIVGFPTLLELILMPQFHRPRSKGDTSLCLNIVFVSGKVDSSRATSHQAYCHRSVSKRKYALVACPAE
jgi:hypothetical protein